MARVKLQAAVQDSGWRDVSGGVQSGWTVSKALLRRVGDQVFLSLTATVAAAPSGGVSNVLAMPSGFQTGEYSAVGVVRVGSVVQAVGTLSSKDLLGISNTPAIAAGAIARCEVSWMTRDTFPTTLPGTPL